MHPKSHCAMEKKGKKKEDEKLSLFLSRRESDSEQRGEDVLSDAKLRLGN